MSAGLDSFPWEDAVDARARAIGLSLTTEARRLLVTQARSVLRENARLHLTAIGDPETFVDRHIGESLEGAKLIDPAGTGTLLDLGSGNGYPGIAIAVARPGFVPCLVESSVRKATFLRTTLAELGLAGSVIARHVARADDLEETPVIDLLVTRAMGDWERVVPRLAKKLGDDAKILIWAGSMAERVFGRRAWSGLALVARHPLGGRERSFIFELSKLPV